MKILLFLYFKFVIHFFIVVSTTVSDAYNENAIKKIGSKS